jgi:hypothetical protein
MEYVCRVDWREELEKLKYNMKISKLLRILVYLLPFLWTFYIAFATYLTVVEGKTYFVIHLIYGLVYPTLLVYIQLKPKTYRIRITSRGLIVNGQPISWRNFKGYIRLDDKLYLVNHRGHIAYLLPSEAEKELKYYLRPQTRQHPL